MHSIAIRADHGIAYFRFRARLSPDLGRQAFADYVEMPDFKPTHRLFWDLRDVTEIDADFTRIFASVQSLSGAFRRFETEAPGVVLVKDAMQYGLARMMEQVVDALSLIRIRVTDRADEAAALLGLRPDELEALRQELGPCLQGPAG